MSDDRAILIEVSRDLKTGDTWFRSKKLGRPELPPAKRRRHNLTFRVNDELRARLQVRADSAQRSLSEEVERIIERSFEADAITERLDFICRSLAHANPDAG